MNRINDFLEQNNELELDCLLVEYFSTKHGVGSHKTIIDRLNIYNTKVKNKFLDLLTSKIVDVEDVIYVIDELCISKLS